jgi:beta-aspartyl-peptidase (threonine type)
MNLPRKVTQHTRAAALLAALLVTIAGCAAPGSRRAPDHADVAAIESLLRAQTDAWNRGDLHAFVAGYAESPERMTFVGSKGEIVRGRAALEARYRKSYPEGKQGTLRFSELDVRRVGPNAYVVLGKWALARPPDDPHGLFTLLFERGERGLEIVHDHSSGAE